jgi:hypothetical protein
MRRLLLILFTATSLAGCEHKTDTISLQAAIGKTPFLTPSAQNHQAAGSEIDPFINTALPLPPTNEYKGRLFELRHDYPSTLDSNTDFPWQGVTQQGLITQQNAMAYVLAIKQYVANDMQKLLFNYDQWDAKQEPWFESIWLGTEREPIHGFYVGSGFPAGTLSQQSLDLTTYVLTLYNKRAAKTLGDIWGTTKERAFAPVFTPASTQYAEGSVIVKFAFVTPCGADWAPMENTLSWPTYNTLNESNGSGNNPSKSKCKNNGSAGSTTQPSMTDVYMMQFDMIVKDSIAAPQTGWVFSTLVYDKTAPGNNAWDKMVPLGATWGNNPDVINTSNQALTPPVTVNDKLTQNWINPAAPEYAKVTLGWDGRLSGPNDGAVVTPAWAGSHYLPQGLATVGCLGCHSNAQYPQASFLLPSTTYPPQIINAPGTSTNQVMVLNEPGSSAWMKWFQNRNGVTPMDPGKDPSTGLQRIGLDYDMVTAFKAIPMWQAALQGKNK